MHQGSKTTTRGELAEGSRWFLWVVYPMLDVYSSRALVDMFMLDTNECMHYTF